MLKVNLEENRIISSAIQPRTECKNLGRNYQKRENNETTTEENSRGK